MSRTIPYLITLGRTVPYLNTLSRTIPSLNTLQLAANHSRVLRHPSRQPIRIEYYVTPELSATVEDTSRLSARIGALQPMLIHRAFNPPFPPSRLPPPRLLTLLLQVYSLPGEQIQISLLLLERLVWNQTSLWRVEQTYNLDDEENRIHIS